MIIRVTGIPGDASGPTTPLSPQAPPLKKRGLGSSIPTRARRAWFRYDVSMRLQVPKNDARYEWTNHVFGKMVYYGLTEGRIRRVLASPKRREEGVAPGTIAVMQAAGTAKNPHEIWVMYQELESRIKNHKSGIRKKKRIITAWRYPGVSKPRGPVPVPDNILKELESLNK